MKQTEILTHATHVNGWFPAVYMSCMSQNFVCFTYRIYPFETFEFFCSCIRGRCVSDRADRSQLWDRCPVLTAPVSAVPVLFETVPFSCFPVKLAIEYPRLLYVSFTSRPMSTELRLDFFKQTLAHSRARYAPHHCIVRS